MMFRPHNVELARSEEAADQAAAEKKFRDRSDEWFAEVRLLDLLRTSQIGLMDCYTKFEESLFDFYPGFSWNKDRLQAQVRLVLADCRFPAIAANIQRHFGFDMKTELESVLVDPAAAVS